MPRPVQENPNAIEIIRPTVVATRPQQPLNIVATEIEAESSFELLPFLKKYVWLLLLMAVVGSGLGFVSVIFGTPMYSSRMLLEIQPIRSKNRNGGSDQHDEAVLQTQILMMRSGTFLRKVVNRIQAETLPVAPVRNDFFTKLRTKVRKELRNPTQIMEEGIQTAASNLSVRIVNGTTLLEITTESTHPEVAADFVNMVGSEFIDQNLLSRSSDAQQAGRWLAAQVDETKLKLKEAEDKLQAFVRSSGNLFAAQETTLADSSLRQFQQELAQAKAERIDKQSRYDGIIKADPGKVLDLLPDQTLQKQRSNLQELRQQRNLLTMKYTPNHYKVAAIDLQIRDIEVALNKESEAAIDRLKTDYESSLRRERLLLGAHSGAAGQVNAQAGKASEYAALRREVEMLRQAYSQILMQASETAIRDAMPQNNMRPVDMATPANEPLRPKPPLNIAMGAFLGLALAGGFGFLRERMDRSVKRPGSARELLNVRELGAIPGIDTAEPMPRNFRVRILLKGRSLKEKALRIASLRKKELVGWQQKSFFAESFRHVVASLLREDEYTKAPQVAIITSPNPSEGKTMVSSNLGICLAETGRKVLVIDADFRRPRIHSIFGLSNEIGLGQVLTDWPEMEEKEDLPGIHATEYPGLSVFVNGGEVEDLSRVLHSKRFEKVLSRLRKEYDIILIDAPPILQIADTRVIDHLADGVMLVLRSGVTDRKRALEAYRCLHEDGANIIGTILNDWQPARKRTDEYYGYMRDPKASVWKDAKETEAEYAPSGRERE